MLAYKKETSECSIKVLNKTENKRKEKCNEILQNILQNEKTKTKWGIGC